VVVARHGEDDGLREPLGDPVGGVGQRRAGVLARRFDEDGRVGSRLADGVRELRPGHDDHLVGEVDAGNGAFEEAVVAADGEELLRPVAPARGVEP
jgi:hypothetical protein